MLSGAFLAEAAATVDNKLNVHGGVLSKYTVGPDRVARFVLVVLTQDDSDDSERRVQVEIKPPTVDATQRATFEAPEASVGEFPGFAFFPIETRLPIDGRWVIDVVCGESTVSLPLIVDEWAPPVGI
ncbi:MULTISPECIES: hypothetical protein [unclassified Mycobacterium]|uniref:hypothetical protein n=1 Tax=unclassified Mycobacterium TaxID=2642494 RepID=UPI0007FF296C|nr:MULTISPECIES: hypothetical protein [unclassified Mycobacterium]OBH02609.1 hypothetical protein A5696_10825 [Mycobacterium sp. E2699]OBI57381.1 hypothetical protein A5705_19960 [Mycobacterium sp. E787]